MAAPFQPANLADFHQRHRQFGRLFQPGGPGPALWALLNTASMFDAMRVVTDHADFPAVLAPAKACWPYVTATRTPKARKEVATAIGGMVRTIMVANGYQQLHVKRAVPKVRINGKWERVFKTGEVYG